LLPSVIASPVPQLLLPAPGCGSWPRRQRRPGSPSPHCHRQALLQPGWPGRPAPKTLAASQRASQQPPAAVPMRRRGSFLKQERWPRPAPQAAPQSQRRPTRKQPGQRQPPEHALPFAWRSPARSAPSLWPTQRRATILWPARHQVRRYRSRTCRLPSYPWLVRPEWQVRCGRLQQRAATSPELRLRPPSEAIHQRQARDWLQPHSWPVPVRASRRHWQRPN